jgi:hypothetical protein
MRHHFPECETGWNLIAQRQKTQHVPFDVFFRASGTLLARPRPSDESVILRNREVRRRLGQSYGTLQAVIMPNVNLHSRLCFGADYATVASTFLVPLRPWRIILLHYAAYHQALRPDALSAMRNRAIGVCMKIPRRSS